MSPVKNRTPSVNGVPRAVSPKYGERTITPAEAQNMIDRSKRPNRPIRASKVKSYALKMKTGRWNPYNSQAISIDYNGDIVNGHHRLRACILAGVPFTTMFMEGVPPDAFAEEDQGVLRSAGHFLAIKGEKDATALAAGARVLYMWETGNWRHANVRMRTIPVDNDMLVDEIERRPILRKAAAYVNKHQKRLYHMPTGMIVGMWALTHGHPLHDQFWSELIEGVNVDVDSPVRLFRDRIAALEYGSGKLKRTHMLANLTKAWNAYATGRQLSSLRWLERGNEAFPEPMTKLKPALLPPEPGELPEAETDAEPEAEEVVNRLTSRRAEIMAKATRLQ